MQIKKYFSQLIVLLGIFFVFPLFANVFAASLQLDPTTVSTTVGQTFKVKININAGTDQIQSTDAWIPYNKDILEAQSIDNGTFFPIVSNVLTYAGRVYVGGVVDRAGTSKTGSGTVATINFKAKQNGTVTLTFDCTTGSVSESNIVNMDTNGTDIINCTANGTSVVTVGSGGSSGGATGTPTPTPTPSTSLPSTGATATPTPTAVASIPTPTTPVNLPRSGISENIPLYGAIGTLLFLIGVGAKLLL